MQVLSMTFPSSIHTLLHCMGGYHRSNCVSRLNKPHWPRRKWFDCSAEFRSLTGMEIPLSWKTS